MNDGKRKVSCEVPGFPGFYDSGPSQEIDYWEALEIEHWEQERLPEWLQDRELIHCPEGFESRWRAVIDRLAAIGGEKWIPELNLGNAWFYAMDYGKCYNLAARHWFDSYLQFMSDEIGLDIPGEFELMQSPREYNFTTDRLFMLVDFDWLKSWHDSLADKPVLFELFAKEINGRFTSYEGFASFYSNDYREGEWQNPFEEWDHNQYGTLLQAVIRFAAMESGSTHKLGRWLDLPMDSGNGEASECLYEGLNESRFLDAIESRLAELETAKGVAA